MMLNVGLRIFALVILLQSQTWSAEPIRVRVLSYNIHHAEGVDGNLDIGRIAKLISSVRPDMVALQEVDQGASRTQGMDQPRQLARLTGMNVVFGANIDLQGGRYGNAILSRYPVVRHTNHLLPNRNDGEQRGVIEAEVQIGSSGETILLLATHFDHRRDEGERIASAEAINTLAKEHDLPALLAGDLNAVVESKTLERLRTTWMLCNEKPLPTIPVGVPTRQIDFVLYRPSRRWRVVEVKVLDEAVASDHRAILAVLEFLPK